MLLIGALLLLMGLGAAYVNRLPVTTAMVYLALGVALGPLGWNDIRFDLRNDSVVFLHAAELTVVVSLFAVGLKLRLPLRDKRWVPALLLASISMTITVGLVTLVGVWALHLPLGAAVLLGGILAPTDPVLASEVQVTHAADRNELRVALSGEAGLNDGTAFPFVLLGLGLLGLHALGAGGWRWWAIDVAWATFGGLGLGAGFGYCTGLLILYLRKRHRDGPSLDEYLLLGLIGLSYGVALQLHAYGFLAVFAAGVAVRAVERRRGGSSPREEESVLKGKSSGGELREKPQLAPAVMAGALLSFNEQIERILEVGMVLLVGAAIFAVGFAWEALWFAPLLFCVLRPVAVLPLVLTRRFTRRQFAGLAWFGIRGIGSIYYLMYAIEHGLSDTQVNRLASLTLSVVGLSILAHGISVTPLLRYIRKEA
ncbi:MAG: cation:proton antiporter [Opitutaceae bacterium]